MIYCLGLSSALENIRQHLADSSSFSFRNFDDADSIHSIDEADLFLIGPLVDQPIKCVQRLVALDSLLSIIIFSDPARYAQTKQALQFSLSVGKNVTSAVYHPEMDYSVMFSNGIHRTRQKRKFSHLNLRTEIRLSGLAASHAGLEHLGHVLERAPVGAVLVNGDLKIIGANKNFRENFNINGNDIFLPSIFPGRQLSDIKRIRQEQGSFVTVNDLNGRYYEVSASTVPEREDDSTILLINDITEKQERDRTISAILESLPQIAWTTGPQGDLLYLNQGWYDYTGKSAAEGLTEWVSEAHPADVRFAAAKWNESVAAGNAFQHSLRLKRFDGEYRWHLVRAVPVRKKNGQITMWVGTSTDIHEQVVLTETLERRVNERTKMLLESNAELEQFAHISSHDLQEPLRKIQTFADIIKGERGSLSENADRYIDKIISTANRMSRLLRDLLSFTRINQQEQEVEVDLRDIVEHVKEDLEILIAQHQAVLNIGDLPVIRARPLQIRQLFYNLMNNSLKYRKPDVAPVVSITSRRLDKEAHLSDRAPSYGEYWEIIVSDNGVGFDQQHADKIFTVFQRLHSLSEYEGTGIGLAIARKVVANHGGDIFAVSSVGNGAAFHVILPAIS